jgi:hypothetical protein
MQITVSNEAGLALVFDLGTLDMFMTSEPGTRDWSAFFQALLAFMQGIIPIITPLFTTPNVKK